MQSSLRDSEAYCKNTELLQTNFSLYHWEGRRNPLSQIWSVGSRSIPCPKICAALLLNIWWTYRGEEERGCVPSSVFKSATQVQRLTTTWQWGGMLNLKYFFGLFLLILSNVFLDSSLQVKHYVKWSPCDLDSSPIIEVWVQMNRMNMEVIYLWKVQRSSSI